MGENDIEADAARLSIRYSGPEVESGRMDARALAPAMLSTAMLVEHSAAIVYGPTTSVRVDVNADFRQGSFTYDLFTSPIVRDVAIPAAFVAALTASNVRELIQRITEAVSFVKLLRGRSVTDQQRDGVNFTLTLNDQLPCPSPFSTGAHHHRVPRSSWRAESWRRTGSRPDDS